MRGGKSRSVTIALSAALLLSACSSSERPVGTRITEDPGLPGDYQIGLGYSSDTAGGRPDTIALGAFAVLASLALIDRVLSDERQVAILSVEDRRAAEAAFSKAFTASAGESVEWYADRSGNGGTVTALDRPERDGDGRPCRRFRHDYQANGSRYRESGVVCRDPTGHWLLQ